MTHSPLVNGIQLTTDFDSRNGRKVDRFIVHHAATTSLAAILSLFAPGGREVSANYALGSDGTLVLAVDEDFSAWTSASWYDDRAVTIEVANAEAGGSWPVSDAAFDKLARLIADVSIRYGFPVNDDTVLTHRELYERFGESYATACPGDLERRKGELLTLANTYRTGDDSMSAQDVANLAAHFDAALTAQTESLKDAIRREGRGRLYYCPNPPADLPRFAIIFQQRTPGEKNVLFIYPRDGATDETRAGNLNAIYGQTSDTVAQAIAAADKPNVFETRIAIALGNDSVYVNTP